MSSSVLIYTTPTCAFCHMAKEWFKENNIEYTEKDVLSDLSAREELHQKSQQMGVPVIDINGEIIVGFDRPRLEEALGL